MAEKNVPESEVETDEITRLVVQELVDEEKAKKESYFVGETQAEKEGAAQLEAELGINNDEFDHSPETTAETKDPEMKTDEELLEEKRQLLAETFAQCESLKSNKQVNITEQAENLPIPSDVPENESTN